ncbi:glycosyltransferase BC10-like [Andrographis paniculata]|uniref:glycosyltransferase BC10-like n=1 Tax=Andrographis paniculata TaxID=175694 RepID=UPI0021E96968|nr:glycosyltransferase BC10-like [Andrographis paniculata]
MVVHDHFKKFVILEDLYFSTLNAFPPIFSPSESPPKNVYAQKCNNSNSGVLTFEDWVSPKNAWHAMSDEELMWRASIVPILPKYPFDRTPKIAFMFLTRGRLPLAPLWEIFFKGNEELFSLYLHTSPEFKDEPPDSSVFYKRRIPSQAVQWGKSSMVDAERRLLANALLDIRNESFLNAFDDPRPIGRGRYNRKMGPTITLVDWRKGSQWFEANRELALIMVSDTKYYPIFRNYCLPPCYMDEHYFPTMVTKVCPNLTSNRTVTWTDWSGGGSHPRMYGKNDVREELLEGIRRLGNCRYNGEMMNSMCFLFARKFHPSTLQPLLRIAPKLFWF